MTESSTVEFCSHSGEVTYRDSADHFENAFLRLMKLEAEDFQSLIELADSVQGEDTLDRVSKALTMIRPLSSNGGGELLDRGPMAVDGAVWHASIEECSRFGMALSQDSTLGWLIRSAEGGFIRELSPPEYEEDYFEGDRASAGGYGDYAEQEGWRLEKARRQLAEIVQRLDLGGELALDVGCGYGYFRVALEKAGFEHEGLEISAFAREMAMNKYGHTTHPGVLEEHWRSFERRFDLITMWDVIEHVPEPVDFLQKASYCLKPGGVLALKTPNVDCPEADYFGPHYHSFKREHLVLLSPQAIASCASKASLKVERICTHSHLLAGFVGNQQTAEWEQKMRGADLTAYLRKAP